MENLWTTILTSSVTASIVSFIVYYLRYLVQRYNINKVIKQDIASTIAYATTFEKIKNNIIKDYTILESNFTEQIIKYSLNYELLNFYQLKQSLITAIKKGEEESVACQIFNQMIFRHNLIFDKTSTTEPFEKAK